MQYTTEPTQDNDLLHVMQTYIVCFSKEKTPVFWKRSITLNTTITSPAPPPTTPTVTLSTHESSSSSSRRRRPGCVDTRTGTKRQDTEEPRPLCGSECHRHCYFAHHLAVHGTRLLDLSYSERDSLLLLLFRCAKDPSLWRGGQGSAEDRSQSHHRRATTGNR